MGTACLCLLLTAPALAAPNVPTGSPSEGLSLEVTVIRASAKGKSSGSLGPLLGQLQRSFRAYKSFQKVEQVKLVLQKAAVKVKRLKDGKTLILSNLGREGKTLRVQVSVDGSNVTMRARSGDLWFHAKQLKEGRAWILAVRASAKR